jgi:TRAP-type C4-dicarboxylate transport system substrate-binding protein
MTVATKTAATLAALTMTTTLAACSGDDTAEAGGQEEVTLTFLTAFPEDHALNDGLWRFVDALKEEAPWVEVDYRGGPETMAPDQMIEGVQSGAVDGAHLPGDYYVQQAPALEIARFTPFTPTEERDAGVADQWGKVHDGLGLHYVGHTVSGIPQVILLTDKTESADLSGKSVRTSSATSNMVKSLGGTPVDLPGSDIYPALERGVVDGAAWTSVGVTDLGLQEQVGYDLSPRFYESLANLVISADTWNSLDSETQDAITRTMEAVEPEIFEYYGEMAAEETAKLRDAGVQHMEFDEGDTQKVLEIAYLDAWDELDWERISSASPEAQEIRDLFEAQYGDDLTEAVPGGTVIEPKG